MPQNKRAIFEFNFVLRSRANLPKEHGLYFELVTKRERLGFVMLDGFAGFESANVDVLALHEPLRF